MKNLSIIIMIFMGAIGCSDYPSEPTLVYRSGATKNTSVAADQNQQKKSTGSPALSKEKSGGESEGESGNELEGGSETQYDALPAFNESMSFEVNLTTKNSTLSFSSSLESPIESNNRYFYEIQFFESRVEGSPFKAMKALKRYLNKNNYNDYSKSSFDTHFVLLGTDLKGTVSLSRGLELSDTNVADLRKHRLKAALLIFHDDGPQISNRSPHLKGARDKRKSFGYRCLVNKEESNESLVKYHRCRYPRGRSKPSS